MNFVYKIPGPLLILTGGFCLSWGGLILRTFESASIWQILFYRSIFFLWVLIAFILYIILSYKAIKDAMFGEDNGVSKLGDHLVNQP